MAPAGPKQEPIAPPTHLPIQVPPTIPALYDKAVAAVAVATSMAIFFAELP